MYNSWISHGILTLHGTLALQLPSLVVALRLYREASQILWLASAGSRVPETGDKAIKNVTGCDLIQLFAGSEGTLLGDHGVGTRKQDQMERALGPRNIRNPGKVFAQEG